MPFGVWPPSPQCKLVGFATISSGGAITQSTLSATGAPVVTHAQRNGAGDYTVTTRKPIDGAHVQVDSANALTAVVTFAGSSISVKTFDDAGVAADAAFLVFIYEATSF